MSTPSKRPLPPRIQLQCDLLKPHGTRVNVHGPDGKLLGSLDRPLADFLQEALEARARGGA